MHYTTLIRCTEAFSYLHNRDWVFIDCRFTLNDAGRGALDYQGSHIPGAVYAHLNDDLSGRAIPGKRDATPCRTRKRLLKGSHYGELTSTHRSLPTMVSLVQWPRRGCGGCFGGQGMRRSPCWTAVLSVGWMRDTLAQAVLRRVKNGSSPPKFNPGMVSTAEEVQAALNKPGYLLLDSRSPDRYRGENETIDPVAGHIPGAISAPFMDNVTADGILKSPGELKDRFQK